MSDHVKKGQKHQNREAFKAHRNIKRAVRDVDAEAALKQKACAGVCRRCAQKVRPILFSSRKALYVASTHGAVLRPHLFPALTRPSCDSLYDLDARVGGVAFQLR